MKIDEAKLEELMVWATGEAPWNLPTGFPPIRMRRRVRLEIAAEPYETQYIARVMGAPEYGFEEFGPTRENVVARAYLAEPRCRRYQGPNNTMLPCAGDAARRESCECGPLAERKVD